MKGWLFLLQIVKLIPILICKHRINSSSSVSSVIELVESWLERAIEVTTSAYGPEKYRKSPKNHEKSTSSIVNEQNTCGKSLETPHTLEYFGAVRTVVEAATPDKFQCQRQKGK